MSREVVRISAFLSVLFTALISVLAFGGEAPRRPAVDDDLFGDGPAKPVRPDLFAPEIEKPVARKPSDVVQRAVPDRYRQLLRTITVEDDRQTFGDYCEYGYWSGTEWKGHKNLPPGYWVYVAPHWHIFAEVADAPAQPLKVNPSPNPAVLENVAKPAARPEPKPKPEPPVKLHGGEQAILKALKQNTAVDFKEMPLKNVIDFLSRKHRIPIVLDAAGLKDAGVEPDTQVTRQLSGISLQSALGIFLDELQLKWVVHNEVLMITSPAKAESEEFMCTRFYDVTDLVNPIPDTATRGTPLSTPDALHLDALVRGTSASRTRPLSRYKGPPPFGTTPVPVVGMAAPPPPAVAAIVGVPPYGMPNYNNNTLPDQSQGADFQLLIDLIEDKVATKSWIDNGGNGTISELPPGDLVILQTREVHEEIEEFLTTLRTRERNRPVFRVELHWLWLDAAHRDALLAPGKLAAKDSSKEIDPQRLLHIAREVPSFHARTNCWNGQEGTIIAGERRALIVDAIPAGDGGTAYQPIVSMPNVGVTASVQPVILPGSDLARLTVRASVTRWMPPRGPVALSAASSGGSHASLDISPLPTAAPVAPREKAGPSMWDLGPVHFGGGFFQVPSENPKSATSASPPAAPPMAQPAQGGMGMGYLRPPAPAAAPPAANAGTSASTPPATPPSAGSPQGKTAQPSTASPPSANPLTTHASYSSHGPDSTSCPIDLPVMPTQEFGTTLRVPLGKPVVVGSVTFAPSGDAGLGEARADAIEVYLIATTTMVNHEATSGATENPKSKTRNPRREGNFESIGSRQFTNPLLEK